VNYESFFRQAYGEKGIKPFPYQRRLAEELWPEFLEIPTGLGKTAAVVLAWAWKRGWRPEGKRATPDLETPRRLVYCLPMRVLVEQTRDNAVRWLHNLGLLAGEAEFEEKDGRKKLLRYEPKPDEPRKVAVHVLMGGETAVDWDLYPEQDAILIGTQDMLLSRALNRGYAASRARWPMQFGLLHTDCLWVYDEIQLMGSGLATTAQLEAFRRELPGGKSAGVPSGQGCRSLWMSATLRPDWLKTVDFQKHIEKSKIFGLKPEDRREEEVDRRWKAKKPLEKSGAAMGETKELAREILEAHRPGARTLVVVNTVRHACVLFDELKKASGKPVKTGKGKKSKTPIEEGGRQTPKFVLLHSRFRPGDRKARVEEALADPPPEGLVVVSTQVVEAGVDVSAAVMFTETAPWASLVQRFGRCNRKGEYGKGEANVFWVPLPGKKPEDALPYGLDELQESTKRLKKLDDVGLKVLDGLEAELPFEHTHVLRRRDLLDLFDTTPDLAGNDLDIDRFVRETEDSGVWVFWRSWEQPKSFEAPLETDGSYRREELCPVPIGEFKDFIKKTTGGKVWRWDFLSGKWVPAVKNRIAPGQVFLLHSVVGGYSKEGGWDKDSSDPVESVLAPEQEKDIEPDANDADPLSEVNAWQTIAEHTDELFKEMKNIEGTLSLDGAEGQVLLTAARWHDRGKAHFVFQRRLPEGRPKFGEIYAKASGKWGGRYERKHFRHELASALAVLDPRNAFVPDEVRNLAAYLVAAHHGKVRLSIRSLPEETRPESSGNENTCRFARGVWDGDPLPETDLGGGIKAPAVILSLEPMELGLCQEPPFAGLPSWAERMIRLRDEWGPFRLAYLEAILRAADIRVSQKAGERGTEIRP